MRHLVLNASIKILLQPKGIFSAEKYPKHLIIPDQFQAKLKKYFYWT